MKKILLILIGITIISSTILAQSGWFWQNPLPQGNSLSSARLINSDINYLAGGAGTIVKTTDGGNSWSFINSGTTENILGLHFVNETTGLVVTNTQIRRTTNQGINWNVVYQYSSSLRSLNFINDNTGIVTGNFGLIAKTTNGGLNFIFSSAGNNPDLKMGCLFNNFGLVVSQEIYRTTNGGSNWTMVYFGNDYFNSVYIVDQNNAFAVGTGGKILKTTNSGLNWTNQPSGITADLESIFFTDINTGYAVGLFGTILKTTNSGTIWYPLTSSTNFLLNEIKFTNLTTGLVTGEAGKILKTTNSGDSWQTISIGSNRNINDISFIDNNTGYAVGNNGTILKTTNGGINWNILISNTVEHLNALMLINPDLIYVIGNNSTLIRSDNGGLNWLSQTISVGNVNLTGVSFIDMNTGAVVGTSTIGAYAYFTTNGGTVWIEKGSFGGSLNDVEFVNSSTCLLYTSDAADDGE
ncbi:MAG: hypothetical protein IAE90_15175, partial [Ignavibacteria bacterium]|nr:hypothetical protein [Ignavibacteria bacterium]